MRTFISSACRAGLRGHSFQTVFALGLLLIFGAYLASLFSPRQPESVALDVGLSGLRFSLILLALFWVQDLIGKEIERHTAKIYLSYPIERANYILGRFIGIAILLLVAAIIFGLLLLISVMAAGATYSQAHKGALGVAYWATLFGLWLDVLIVTSFTVCIATFSTVPSLPLAMGAAFAIAGHSIGAVIEYLANGAYGRKDLVEHYGATVEFARWLLPDLSRLDWRIWPIYNEHLPTGTISLSCIMAFAYIAFILLIATQAFRQREFD